MAVKKKAAKKKPAKKKIIKKQAKKKTGSKSKKPGLKETGKKKENIIGKITHYFPHVNAAVIKLKAPLAIGDNIKIKGHTTDFTQAVDSIQMDRVNINSAKKGQEVGVMVTSRVRQHDIVYKA